jgi:hypothetical protein
MSQLSCPACHVSINPRGALALAYCPRCLTRRRKAVPLVARESGGLSGELTAGARKPSLLRSVENALRQRRDQP